MESTQKQEQVFEIRKRVESEGSLQIHKRAVHLSVHSKGSNKLANNRLDFMKFINQHAHDYQSEKSDEKHGQLQHDCSQSKASSLFQMGQLLEEKALQVRDLCARLEQRQTQFIELEKKMMELMQHNHNYAPPMSYHKGKCIEDMRSSASEAISEMGHEQTMINIDYVFEYKDKEEIKQTQTDLRSTTKKLTRFKYLEEQPCRSRLPFTRLMDDNIKSNPTQIQVAYVPKCSSSNCLFNQEAEDYQNSPKMVPTCLTRTNMRISDQVSIRIEPPNFREDQHEIEEFQRNLSILLEARNSALTSLHMTPRYGKCLTMQRVINQQVHNESELSLCKFKRLVRQVINCLNQIWKMGSKMHKQNQSELSGQILRGLKADLIAFVQDFNKKYKAFRDLGVNSNLFELEVLEKLSSMVELSKSFPCG